MSVEAERGPQTGWRKKQPGDEPEKVKGQAKDRGADAIPKRYAEANGDKRNESEKERAERGFLHERYPAEMFFRI
jgi:hypothetical protein